MNSQCYRATDFFGSVLFFIYGRMQVRITPQCLNLLETTDSGVGSVALHKAIEFPESRQLDGANEVINCKVES